MLLAFSPFAQQNQEILKSKPAEPEAAAVNTAVLMEYPFTDTQDFKDAHRDLIEALPGGQIPNADGSMASHSPRLASLDNIVLKQTAFEKGIRGVKIVGAQEKSSSCSSESASRKPLESRWTR